MKIQLFFQTLLEMNNKPPWKSTTNKTTPLDNLMMSYADLSGGKKGSGGAASFKGPALKDVKIEKSSAAEYKASQKSRDWSTLSQNLEDAFIISSASSAIPTPHQVAINVSFQQQNPIIPPQQVIPQSRQESIDEWGDFQDFNKTNTNVQNQQQSSFSKPPTSIEKFGITSRTINQPHISTQQPLTTLSQSTISFNNADDEEDDFADFVTAAPNRISPQTSANSIPNVEFAVPSQTILPSLSSIAPSLSSNPQKSDDVYSSNTIGSRLATFQEESPIHRFKPTVPPSSNFEPMSNPLNFRSNLETGHKVDSDDDDDFGDFATSRNVITSSNQNTFPSMKIFPAPVSNTAVDPFESNSNQGSLMKDNTFTASFASLPTLQPIQTSDDKYSAFRNAFAGETTGIANDAMETSIQQKKYSGTQDEINNTKNSTIDIFGDDTMSEQPSSYEVDLKPTLLFPVPIQNSSNSSDALNSRPKNVLNSHSKSSLTEEDDFGDFIAVSNDEKIDPSENCKDLSDVGNKNSVLRKPNETKHVRSDNFFMPQQVRGVTGGDLNSSAIMPIWHDSEPPPLMDDHSNSYEMNKEHGNGAIGMNDDFFQGFEDHDVASIGEPNDGFGCTSILDEDPYFDDESSNKTLSQKETTSNKLAPSNSIVDSVLRNPSITSLNLRLGSSSPEEETVSHCNEVQNPHERLDNVDPLSNDNFARSNSDTKEEKLTNGLEVHDDSSKMHINTWLAALKQIYSLISQATDAFTYIPNNAVLQEVLDSEEGSNYIKNIIEIYRVYKRIKVSHQKYTSTISKIKSKSFNDEAHIQLNQTQDKIEQAWKQLIINLNGKSIIPERALFDFSAELLKELENDNFQQKVGNSCGICLLNVSSNDHISKLESAQNGKFVDAILKHGNGMYHSTCANFWVNRVELVLPSLNATK